MDVRRGEASVEVETDELKLVVDRATLRLDLESRRHPLRIAGSRTQVIVDGDPVVAKVAGLDGFGEIRTRLGVATRIDLRCKTDRPGLDLRLAIEVADEWPGIALEVELHNRGDAPVAVSAMDPFAWHAGEAGVLELPGDPAELRLFRMGYQSWSPAGWVRLDEAEPRPRFPWVRRVHQGPFSPAPTGRLHVSDFATSLRASAHAGLTLGFLTHDRFLTHVALEHAHGNARALRARVATEDAPLPPGASLRGERLWIGLDTEGADGIARWAERAGEEMRAPVPARVGTGWCSWYQFFTGVTASDVRRNIRELGQFRGQIDAIQIDDGYQAAVGDWMEFDPDFPDGVAPLAAEIRAAGFRPGLWLAPFLVSRASRVAREHEDWLLKGRGGRPRIALFNPGWKGRICYALDVTHPEVLGWLSEVFGTVRGWGFDYLKLDFLYAGALSGARSDPDLPSGQAYRQAIEVIREAAGERVMLLGCGAPLGPSIGLFEAMRIGPDVAPTWRAPFADWLLGVAGAPAAENSVRNTLARAALHQRLWVNDPDCLVARDLDTGLTETEVQTLAAVIATSGGMVVLSDDLAAVGPERRRLLQRLLPPIGRAPEVGPPGGGSGREAEIPDRLVQRFPDGSSLLLLVNLADRPRSFEVDPATIGIGGPARVYDVLRDVDLGVFNGKRETEPVDARGSLLLRVTEARRVPSIVGSTFHLSGGAIETARLREVDGALRLRLRLPGTREGRVLVGVREAPVSVHVGFEDDVEVEVAAPGVEDRGEIPDE